MWTGPPKELGTPKPMSSIRTSSTFGAPAGAFTSKRGGGVALRTSSSVIGGYVGSAIGRWIRSAVVGVMTLLGAAAVCDPDGAATIRNAPAAAAASQDVSLVFSSLLPPR